MPRSRLALRSDVYYFLGCGIGVLLCMFWVLALVIIRSFKGSKEEIETPKEDGLLVYQGVTFIFPDEPEFEIPPQYEPAFGRWRALDSVKYCSGCRRRNNTQIPIQRAYFRLLCCPYTLTIIYIDNTNPTDRSLGLQHPTYKS